MNFIMYQLKINIIIKPNQFIINAKIKSNKDIYKISLKLQKKFETSYNHFFILKILIFNLFIPGIIYILYYLLNNMLLYNHLTGKSEDIFKDKDYLTLYLCGPTIYSTSHIGHGRTFSVFDSMRKYWISKGKTVNFGMNITDIDDKINNSVKKLHYAKLTGDYLSTVNVLEEIMQKEIVRGGLDYCDLTPPMELYHNFVNEKAEIFWNELESINVDKPTITLRVSEVLSQIEDMIQSLINKGMAYESNGSVYFNTNYYHTKFCKCPLNNSTDDDINLKDGYTGEKINPEDFALWKKEKFGWISFPSKWGKGTPGWSIECSVMSSIMFGNNIDLHGGGIDLKYPHHHNEVLQSNAHFEKNDVFKHFAYVGHVCVNGEKMAQSVGNYLSLKDYLSAHSANSMRLLFWMTSWQKPVDLTDEIVKQAEILEKRINEFLATINFTINNKNNSINKVKLNSNNILDVIKLFNNIDDLLTNDFKTHEVIPIFNEIITETNKLMKEEYIDNVHLKIILNRMKDLLYIMGFVIKEQHDDNTDNGKLIDGFTELRKIFKSKKQYEMSDYIRDELFPKMGYCMQDLPQGTKVSKL